MPKAVHVSAVHDFELREGLTVSQSPGYFQVNVSGAQISVIEYNPLQLAPFRIVSVTSLFIHQESIPYPRMDTIPLCHTGRIIPEGRKRRLIMRNINLTTGEEQQYDI